MRITFNMQFMQYQQFIDGGLTNITDASLRVLNKRNLLSPDQNPSQYVGAYNVQRMIDELTQFSQNAKGASNWLTSTDKEINNLLDILKAAKNDLAIGGISSEADAESRKALALEAQNLYARLMDAANATNMGRYIFGGYMTQTKPFTGGTNSVSQLVSLSNNGGQAEAKGVFSDLPELKSGKYTAKISVNGNIASLQVLDEKGNPVMIDTNGSDQSGNKGNNSGTTLNFEYKPGAVVNTGRGIAFKLPENATSGVELSFNYTAGAEISYMGDAGSIFSQIGYNQELAMNIPGSNIFSQSYKTLQGSKFNTIGGLAATLGTYFSSLDKSNSSIGDTIKVGGTDHNGNKVGAAMIISPMNPKLDLSNATEAERTLTVGYGDKVYKVVVPKQAYKTMDDLTSAVNNQLKQAEYVGSMGELPEGMNEETYKNYVQTQIESGKFTGEKTESGKLKYYTDISSQVYASSDGDRLTFVTSSAGDNVSLSVSGGARNALGFNDLTMASVGKDTTFEIGFDPHKNFIQQIATTHTGFDLAAGGTQQFVINGQLVNFTIPPATPTTATIATGADLSGATDYTFTVKDKVITVKGADLAAATTLADKQDLINSKIAEAGLAGEANVNLTAAGADFDIDLTTLDVNQKEYEMAFDKALKAAGFDFKVNVFLTPQVGTPGTYDINFNLVNGNIDKATSLTTVYMNNATVPPTQDLQYASPSKVDGGNPKEKTLGDLVSFVKNLYGESVDVSLQNGKLTVKDMRSGDSKLSMNINPGNEGVYATDNISTVSGKYTGAYNDKWNVEATGTLNADGSRDISISITDKAGNKIYDRVTANYLGGSIDLPYGIKFTPTDMELTAAEPTRTTAFTVDLKAKPSLSFGDMNVIENGSNVNIFQVLKNLEHALLYDITKNGFAEPTAWKDSSFKSTAKPFLDGVFQGNFNDNWTYEVAGTTGKTNLYLQNEYKTSTGDIRFDQTMATNLGNNISFGVDYYNNTTGKTETLDVSLDLTKAVPPVTDSASMQNFITTSLNSDSRFLDRGIRFADDGGKIVMESGSGTKIANFTNNGTGSAKVLTSYVLGFAPIANNPMKFPVTLPAAGQDIQVTDPFASNTGADLAVKQFTIPAGTYNTKEELLAAINAEVNAGTAGRITAEFDSSGALTFATTTGVKVQSSSLGGTNLFNMGLTGGVDARSMATGAQKPATNLSEATDAQRTLSFKYMGGTPPTAQSVNITLDKREYSSVSDMTAAINEKLLAIGIPTTDLKAVANSQGIISFTAENNNLTGVTVEGDYDGFLGFPKAGDEAKVKVTDSSGKIVQEVVVSSANKTVNVAEGLQLGFNKGSLNAADSFSAAVGSGIENTIPYFDMALKQVLETSAVVGNRGSRIETVVKFHDTVIKSNEAIKSGYLGSTELDQVKSQTDLVLANKAYETAMSVVGKAMSISLLDFLR